MFLASSFLEYIALALAGFAFCLATSMPSSMELKDRWHLFGYWCTPPVVCFPISNLLVGLTELLCCCIYTNPQVQARPSTLLLMSWSPLEHSQMTDLDQASLLIMVSGSHVEQLHQLVKFFRQPPRVNNTERRALECPSTSTSNGKLSKTFWSSTRFLTTDLDKAHARDGEDQDPMS